jgi:hypothetical protein
MAERSLLRISRTEPAAALRKRDDQDHRRKLRIAIRQLERAELYVVSLQSLNLDEPSVEEGADHLIRELRSLRQYLLHLKLTA